MSSFVSSELKTTNVIFRFNDIREIEQHLQKETKVNSVVLALFDFDDTLAMTGHASAGHLGGLKWRDQLRKCIEELKKSEELKSNSLIFEYLTLFIAKTVEVDAVQPETASFIKKLENKGYQVMVFTARGRSGENAWYKLNIGGVDAFTEQQMHNAGIHLTPGDLPTHDKVYKNSMIFSQNIAKDIIIRELFDKCVLNPSNISILGFEDDKRDPVDKVGQVAEKYGVPYVGVHYTAIEEREEKEYDLLKATIQLVNLFVEGKFLPKETLENKTTEFKATNKTPVAFFKETIKELDKFFHDNKLYRPFSDTDEFHSEISKVAQRTFRL